MYQNVFFKKIKRKDKEQILFIDDSPINISLAEEGGYCTVLITNLLPETLKILKLLTDLKN